MPGATITIVVSQYGHRLQPMTKLPSTQKLSSLSQPLTDVEPLLVQVLQPHASGVSDLGRSFKCGQSFHGSGRMLPLNY